MSRYITAFLKLDDTEVVERFIDTAPSIDIVFCKECEHYKIFDNGYECEMGLYNVAVNDFCSYGKREGE